MEQQEQRPKRRLPSWKIYSVAKQVSEVTIWIWTAVIVALLVQIIPAYLFANIKDNTAWGFTTSWLQNTHLVFPWNVLRTLVEAAALLLIVVTFLAWVIKYSLQNANPDAFDKLGQLVRVLQQDSSQLESLQQQFQQQLQKQDACIEALERISNLLQQAPTSSSLLGLQVLSQQQYALQKEFSRLLQNIETRTSEQAQWLGDLYQQDQQTQEKISDSLGKISVLLEQMRDSLM
ncbi:MAG: hypothetical protein JO202_10025 [Ktedonobacteraceae bacterium]|nr:hypothetical protein [Ktedonobacteraceae bacterium]